MISNKRFINLYKSRKFLCSWFLEIKFENDDISARFPISFIWASVFFFIFSSLRYFDLLFWNHTCTLDSVRSICLETFLNFIMKIVTPTVSHLRSLFSRWLSLRTSLSEVFSYKNIRILIFLEYLFEQANLWFRECCPIRNNFKF